MSEVHLVTVCLGIVTLSLLISAASKGRDRFAFRVISSDFRNEADVEGEYLIGEITGDIQNMSTKANGLSELYLVRWSADRLGFSFCNPRPVQIKEGVESISLPLRFEGKQDRRVTLVWRFRTEKGSAPTDLEVVLEDSEGKLNDRLGCPKDPRNIERRREFVERFSGAPGGELASFLVLYLKIRICDLLFTAKRLVWFMGL
ncbi:hypothetical protein FXN61_05610 [Lentzea sp. PSKA42]|uniref:Uncharacterized protein n=1 Tax=Lentzea indica TaxID=2604800 RepID=A0ABX1FBL0_9PSEU|nr:hypothetical protein [Lentzea indica]NKE56331.1 hypothetical protein [Lentzea indica]